MQCFTPSLVCYLQQYLNCFSSNPKQIIKPTRNQSEADARSWKIHPKQLKPFRSARQLYHLVVLKTVPIKLIWLWGSLMNTIVVAENTLELHFCNISRLFHGVSSYINILVRWKSASSASCHTPWMLLNYPNCNGHH